MISRLVPGRSAFCRMVRLTGEGDTGDGWTWASAVANAANATNAAHAATILNMLCLPTYCGRLVACARAACLASCVVAFSAENRKSTFPENALASSGSLLLDSVLPIGRDRRDYRCARDLAPGFLVASQRLLHERQLDALRLALRQHGVEVFDRAVDVEGHGTAAAALE